MNIRVTIEATARDPGEYGELRAIVDRIREHGAESIRAAVSGWQFSVKPTRLELTEPCASHGPYPGEVRQVVEFVGIAHRDDPKAA